jgi:hypothetical protein
MSARAGATRAELVQFGVVLNGWPDCEELVFLSRWHTLTAKAARTHTTPTTSPETRPRTRA